MKLKIEITCEDSQEEALMYLKGPDYLCALAEIYSECRRFEKHEEWEATDDFVNKVEKLLGRIRDASVVSNY